MRNYIILNGVNSNTITGLLISKLPPITKPKIRTQTEEIDGRDGDIVTKLGYSAYDKEIEIGLYGNFDINEVIAYFNTEGTIVFSNEADKYYNYQILDQIDYEKLIRFKTAKVKMHVQPFKYPLEETPVDITIETINNEAETMSINNTANAPITLALKGNTSQDGTPTPTAPVEVKTVTGRQEIDIVGKNLLKLNDVQETTTNGITYSCTNGVIKLNGTATGGVIIDFESFYLPSGNYYLSRNLTGTTSGSWQNYIRNSSSSIKQGEGTFTTSTGQNIFFRLYFNSGVVLNNAVFKPQIEKGSTATAYEPYQSQSYELDLGNLELCKIGDYQDYFFKDNNKWYIKREIGKVVLDGTETDNMYAYGTSGGVNRISTNLFINLIMPYTDTTRHIDRIISNYFHAKATDEVGSMYQYQKQVLFDTTSDITSVALWKQWLTTHNVTVYYVLAEPTDEEITDNTLIGQLNAIENARSYDTITNISQNTANKPFIINATAVQKGSDTGTVDNIGNIYAKPTIDIEGSGIVEIYLDGNQIFNVDLSTINECVIDTTNLEAYNPATTQLMNRQVTGDYSNFKINVGDNQVKVSGAVTKATISNYTRWL